MELRAAFSRAVGVKGTTAASAVQLYQPAASNEFLAFAAHAGAAAFDLVSGHRLQWLIDATDLCASWCGLQVTVNDVAVPVPAREQRVGNRRLRQRTGSSSDLLEAVGRNSYEDANTDAASRTGVMNSRGFADRQPSGKRMRHIIE